MSQRATLRAVGAVYIVAGLLPILAMVWRSLTPGGHLGFAAFARVFSTGHEWELLRNSVVLAGLTTIGAGVLGIPLAVFLARTDLPLRRILTPLFVLPLLLPPTVVAYGWFALLGRAGLLGAFLPFDVGRWLFSLVGCILVLVACYLPVVLLLTMAALRGVNPTLEDAGRLTATSGRVLLGITLPQALFAIGPALLLVYCMVLGEFGAPSFLRYNVFAVESMAQFSAFYDPSAATAAAMPLLGMTLFALLALKAVPSASTVLQSSAGAGRLTVFSLGRWRVITVVLVVAIWFLFVGAPLGALFVRSASGGAFAEALQRAGDSLVRSLLYAAAAATLLLAVGFLIGFGRAEQVLGRWWEGLVLFLFALPGPVLGIGFIMLWNRPGTSLLYGSPVMLVLGLLAQYAILPVGLTLGALAAIPRTLNEAAALAGASWWRRLRGVTLPLCRPGLVAAWVVGFLFCIRDTGLSMILYPPGRDTLPVRLFTLMANGRPEMLAALCVLMVLAALAPLGLLGIVLRRRTAS